MFPPNTILLSGLERDSQNSFVNANMKAFPFMWVYFALFWTALCLGKGIFCTDTNMRVFLSYNSIVLVHVAQFSCGADFKDKNKSS